MMVTVIQITVILVLILAVVLCSAMGNRRWKQKWPPINDDEFMARCPPGTNRKTALRVRRIVSEQLGIEYDRVYPEQNFVKDLDCG